MNIWVIDSTKGITLTYYSSKGIFLDEDLVSGLISALNQLTMVEFKQPIQSINMGGFKWIYMVEPNYDLLFVMSDSIDVSTDTIKGRLNFLKHLFMKSYVVNVEEWEDRWFGDVGIFEPFKETIEVYYDQWTNAGDVDSLAEFYDAIGIFQELLNLTRNCIENHSSKDMKESIYNCIIETFINFKDNKTIKKEAELQNITFSRESGYDIFEIDPMNCDMEFVKDQMKFLVKKIYSLIKNLLGHDSCLVYFKEEGIYQYCVENYILLRNLNLDKFIIELLLTE